MRQIKPLPVRFYIHSEPFKSERHARLGGFSMQEHAPTAREIARVLGGAPKTRRHRPGVLRRVLRAIVAWL